MKLKFKFSKKTSLVCLILILGMLRASYWQWERHHEKLALIKTLEQRLAAPAVNLTTLMQGHIPWEDLLYRQVIVDGNYDFSNEIAIANRRYQDTPGKHVITPMKIDGQKSAVLVNRGFLPLGVSSEEQRQKFQNAQETTITAIIKPSLPRTFFLQPENPKPENGKKSDNWLRIDVDAIGKQLSYPLLPIYLDKISATDKLDIEKDLIKSDSDKTDMLVMPGKKTKVSTGELKEDLTYPIPAPDKMMSAGRHLGYVFEWAFMALLTGLIGIVLQLRRH